MADQFDVKAEVVELKTKEEIERKAVEKLQSDMAAVLKWKTECENTNKLVLRTVMVTSAVATGIGAWMSNIKAFVKHLIDWASS